MVDLVVEDGACAGVMARRVSAGESHLTAEELRAGAPDRGEGGLAGLDADVGRGARARASVSGAEPVSGAAPGSAAAQVVASASVLAPSSAAPVAASAPAPASATTHASAPVSVPVAAAPAPAPFPLRAPVTILATGGIGGLYDRSTNYPQLTGDACLIAAEHGIALEHLDYVQIHPTGLYTKVPGRVFLISESCRGEGAVLLNRAGERFTDELAPRDVVAAAIREQMRRDGSPFVRLSFAPVDPDVIKGHFGTIRARCLEELGLDILTDPIPVVPTQHYFMGGIAVDVDGASSMPGLYAVGETACNGVHGRNRLASNSLLEALVWAGRAAGRIATGASLAVGALPGVGGFEAADADAGGAAGGFGVAGAGADGALGGGLPSAMSTRPEPAASAPDPTAPARWAPGLGDIAQPSPAADEPARPTTSAAMPSLVIPARPTAKETA
ncbi:MAG: FAD-binding protein [Coriobacteriaceae bacterium]|nr:FAD-binding protein [Coriobacteriaceae bacterium]